MYLQESFEGGSRPEGWTEEMVSGSEPWRYRNGGHSPNDNNWLVPPEQIDITRNPPAAYEGNFNAIFFKQGVNNEKTRLITPGLDILGGSSIELSFYLCQIPWTFEGSTGWDILRIYYKISAEAPWVLLKEYLDPVYNWERQAVLLPNPSANYSIAFEGQTRWGYGTCIDDIVIEEKGLQQRYVGNIEFHQPATSFVPSGSKEIPLLRTDFRIFGNTGTATLQSISFKSLNTDEADIVPNSVKLFATASQFFDTDNPLGSPTGFIAGTASFAGLNYNLPPGLSYLWVTCDIDPAAKHGDILDVKVGANCIMANDSLYPATDQSPEGERIILESRYSEDFEAAHNWTLTGEFEVGTPNGLGGTPGNPNPPRAYSGSRILGTDLTGMGIFPYNYEPDLTDNSGYYAASPSIDALYYTNLNIFFKRYLNIEVWDKASIQVSADDGTTWHPIWVNNSYFSDFAWTQEQISVPNIYSRSGKLKIRYKLGPTDGQNNYSGWNIDDVFLTGEFISKDAGVSGWIYPLSGSGHSVTDSVTISIRNYGGKEITGNIPVAYSFNGGASWVIDTLFHPIPVDSMVTFTFPTKTDLSVPGLRPSVLAKTLLPGDQYSENDGLSTSIYIVPTYQTPYEEDFEANKGFWITSGINAWEYGPPAGNTINSSSSGIRSWCTGLDRKYGELISQKDQIIFEDDFETDNGWILNGEFERNIPANMFLPYFSYSGYYCLGTDLSGQGSHPYLYENGISPGSAYTATSPPIDVSHYSNISVSFAGWLMIQSGDSARFEVSPDNGMSWMPLWENSEGEIMDPDYQFHQYHVDDSLSYSGEMRFRFSLFYSSPAGAVAEGWNIDDFVITADNVNTSAAILNSPSFDLTGLRHPVFESRIWTDTEQGVDGATLSYSLDDGSSWIPLSGSMAFDTYWNWYTGKYVEALGRNGWSGQSGGWKTVRHLLPAAMINNENVQFRLEFNADKFNNEYDGIGWDDVKICDAPSDVGVKEILDPVSSCELANDKKFRLRLQNYGIMDLQPGDTVIIGYTINREGFIQSDTEMIRLTQVFPAGTSKDFDMTRKFDFSMSGDYYTDVYSIEDDPYYYHDVANDTVSRIIRVNKPYVELGPDVSTLRPDTITLTANDGNPANVYLWQDGSTNPEYNVLTEGTYYVRVNNDLGCMASDTVHILQLIADVGVGSLLSPASGCEIGSQVPVRVSIENYGTDTLDINDTVFVFGIIDQTLQFSDTVFITDNFYPGDVKEYTFSKLYDFNFRGIYKMKLYTKFRDDFQYQNDTLFIDPEVYGYPDIDLGPDTIVRAAEYILSPTPGYFSYLWHDASGEETFTVVQPGTSLCSVVVNDIHGCETSDSVYVTLNVTDVALEKILSPAASCNPSENIRISARLKNTGNQVISAGETINLGYTIDGNLPLQEDILLTEDLVPGAHFDHEFSQQETLSTGQWYDLAVYLDYAGDMKISNDTLNMPLGIFDLPVVDLGEDYQVIAGLDHTLDAGSGFVSYAWQDGSSQQTFRIDEPGIGLYSVVVTDDNGCTAFDEVEILLAVPDIGVSEIVHPVTTCDPGTSMNIRLAIKNYGKLDIEASANILVSYTINGAAPVTENLSLDAPFEHGTVIYHTFTKPENITSPGHFDISANTAYGSDLIPSNDKIDVSVDVYEKPVVRIGNGEDTMLIYDPLILSPDPGYLSYEWQDGSTTKDYAISEPGTGLYYVTVTGDNGCSASDTVYVIYDRPDLSVNRIIGPISACMFNKNTLIIVEVRNNGYCRIDAGEMIRLSYSVESDPVIPEVMNFTNALQPGQTRKFNFTTPYDFRETGIYQLNVKLDYTPDSDASNDSLSSKIYNWGVPVVEIGGGQDTLHTKLPLTFDAGTGYVSYLWQDNSTGSTMDVNQYGLYYVRVEDDEGCTAADSVFVDYPLFSGPWLIRPEWIRIFPNPVKDYLHLEITPEEEKDVIIELYNIQNQMVMRKELLNSRTIEMELNVEGFTPGFYYLKVLADGMPYIYKLIIE